MDIPISAATIAVATGAVLVEDGGGL